MREQRQFRGKSLGALGLLLAMVAGACGSQTGEAAREPNGTAGVGGTHSPHPAPGRPDAGGAGEASHSGGDGGTGGGGVEGGDAGAGAGGGGPDIASTSALLDAAVLAKLGSGKLVVDTGKIAGLSFELEDYVGPSEWTVERDRVDLSRYRRAPRITLHMTVGEDEELGVIVGLPTPSLPYAEPLRLERRGDAWVARSVPTASQLEIYFDEELFYAFYKAAWAELAFADDDGDGSPDRVLFAATASQRGEPCSPESIEVGYAGASEAPYGVLCGKDADVFPSEGPRQSQPITVSEIETSSPWYVRGESDGLLPSLALSRAVAPGSTFVFENALGERSQPELYTVGDFVCGVKPVDPLAEGWTLVGDGLDLDGTPFHLRQTVTLIKLEPLAGDFETEPSVATSLGCYEQSGVQTEHDGEPALAGAQSYYTATCQVTFRVLRAPGATRLTFEAIRDSSLAGSEAVEIVPLGAGAKSEITTVQFLATTEPDTISVPLPARGDDFLVTLPSGLWLDSVRTD